MNETSAMLPWLTAPFAELSQKLASGTLAHAYILAGPKGVGKLRLAQKFAGSLICESLDQGHACGQCKGCLLEASGHHPDSLLLAPEAPGKAFTIDLIRSLSAYAQRSSHAGGARIAILADAHAMNVSAANALLKTLEEPQQATYLFLVTDQPGHLSATIRSRCQRLFVGVPTQQESLEWLRGEQGEGFVLEDAESCLSVAGGAPLYALDLLQTDTLPLRRVVERTWVGVLLGRAEPSELLSALSALEPSAAVQQLLYCAGRAAKAVLSPTAQHDRIAGGHFGAIAEWVNSLPDPVTARAKLGSRSLKLYEEIEVARRQLSSSSNPSPRLILESLSWLTSRAFK